jgi:hypothetical protein
MNEVLLQVLLEGGTLAVFVVFVIYQARTGREERKELTDTMLKMVTIRDDHADEQMKVGMESLDKVNGSLIELTKANAELSKVVAVHDQKIDDRYDSVIRTLDRIANGG